MEGFFNITCDNCRKDFPCLYAFSFFSKAWHICPTCSAALRYIVQNQAPYVSEPHVPRLPRTMKLAKKVRTA